MKIASSGTSKILESKGGISYGAITGLDVTPEAERIIVSNKSGEILTFELLSNL